jgi:hypothetical protein
MLYKTYVILFAGILIVLSLLSEGTFACSYDREYNKSADEGELVCYTIQVTNNDHPLGVKVRIDVNQSFGKFSVKNPEHDLIYLDSGTTYIYVHTNHPDIELIRTTYTAYEKDELEDEYQENSGGTFTTTIIHPPSSAPVGDHETGNNIFLGILGVSLIGMVSVYVYYRWNTGFPLIRGYSLLKKGEVLNNENRKKIFTLIYEKRTGMTAAEITRELGFGHHRLVQYHLGKLSENGYVRRIDNHYFPTGFHNGGPFIDQVKNAMIEGDSTPSAIARRLGTYPNKVKRYMIRHGMWNK